MQMKISMTTVNGHTEQDSGTKKQQREWNRVRPASFDRTGIVCESEKICVQFVNSVAHEHVY